jgi:transposase
MRTVAAFGIVLLAGCSVDPAPLEHKPLAQGLGWEPPEHTATPIEPLVAPRVVQTEVARAPVELALPPLPDLPPPPPAAVEREHNPCEEFPAAWRPTLALPLLTTMAPKPKYPPGPPMDLANMRAQGVNHLIAFCLNDACRHQALIDVSSYPPDPPVPWFRLQGQLRQVRRSRTSHRRAVNWKEQTSREISLDAALAKAEAHITPSVDHARRSAPVAKTWPSVGVLAPSAGWLSAG